MRWRDNVLTALLAAALCVMAPLTIPLSPWRGATALTIPLRGRVHRLLSAGVKERDNL